MVESCPSLSLASLVVAVILSLCSHLFVKSLSIAILSLRNDLTLLGIVHNSGLAWVGSSGHTVGSSLKEASSKLLSKG